jgi:multiple sugar transport system permease protein
MREEPGRPSRLLAHLRAHAIAYGFLAPALVFIGVFLVYPIVDTLYLSFTSFNFVYDNGPRFIGPANYVQLSTDSGFQSSLGNTVEFTVLFLPVFVVGGLVAAAVIESLPRFGGIFRTIVFLPVIVALSVTGVMFDWIFDARFGLVNHVLDMVGLHALTRDWLTDPGLALPVIVAVSLWQQIGVSMLIFIAGLRSIPGDIYEAAYCDGASRPRAFFAITVPNIMESTVIATVWGIVQAIKVFDLPYVMTKGGPGGATETLYLHLWNVAFQDFQMGLASSIGYVMAIAILVLSAITLRGARSEAT